VHRNAVRLVTVEERRREGRKSLPNVVRIVFEGMAGLDQARAGLP